MACSLHEESLWERQYNNARRRKITDVGLRKITDVGLRKITDVGLRKITDVGLRKITDVGLRKTIGECTGCPGRGSSHIQEIRSLESVQNKTLP
jgi:hypothetical protein